MNKKLYFIAFLIFTTAVTNAQEFIKTVNDNSVEHFVRRKSNTEWVYCVRNSLKELTITCMNSSGLSFPSMTLTNIDKAYDMDVSENILFFVGLNKINGQNFGYLNLSQFPNGNAYYFPFEEQLYRILPVPGQFQFDVYIAGIDNNTNRYCLTEAYYYPPVENWYFNKYEILTPNYIIDDIAATTNYIVFTVRNLTDNNGYIFNLPRTNTVSGPVARPTQINMQRVTTTAYSTLLIEAATSDTVYIVHSNSSSKQSIAVHKFTATGTHVASRLLNGPSIKLISMDALDITYNKYHKKLSILTNISKKSSYHDNVEWHISNGQMLSGDSVSGHMYHNTYIESFDHLQGTGTTRNIIAAGTYFTDTALFNRIYRMEDIDNSGNCTESIATSFPPLNFTTGNAIITWNTYSVEYTRGTLPKTTGTTTVSTVCTQNQ